MCTLNNFTDHCEKFIKIDQYFRKIVRLVALIFADLGDRERGGPLHQR